MATTSWSVLLSFALLPIAGCAHSGSLPQAAGPSPVAASSTSPPTPDPRVGLKAGQWDAGLAAWNMRLVSNTHPAPRFDSTDNSDLAFTGHYVIQGNYSGFQIWDIADLGHPRLKTAYYCPASQGDVSVYHNLLFVSNEGLEGRLDCAGGGVTENASPARFRGIRIFDISDLGHPKSVASVQTCRGSHTHTLLVSPADHDNVYIYVSGTSPVRPAGELAGCSDANPAQDPNSALFRIEVIKVPLGHPEQAAIISTPHILKDLNAVTTHGVSAAERAEVAAARARGAFVEPMMGEDIILTSAYVNPILDSMVTARGGRGAPTGADSAALRKALPVRMAKAMGMDTTDLTGGLSMSASTPVFSDQCHDITVYPAVGLAGGACDGYGMLLDIHDPAHPTRAAAAADTNFSYWHSATFNNDGTRILFSDEWGGGGAPKCRASDPHEWGADAIFSIVDGKLLFRSYYKMAAPQTAEENCVAHNGSLIPIPGRDVMVQAWYQGGVSVFDWTDPARPREIAFFDRGPIDSTTMVTGGTWSAYWYNGAIISSEITRGLDVLELTPSPLLTQNEIDAAKTVRFTELNVQGQPKFVWPPSYALARAYVDQLARVQAIGPEEIARLRMQIAQSEKASGSQRRDLLNQLAAQLDRDVGSSGGAETLRKLTSVVRDLSAAATRG
jgi:hypothetical protein